MKIVIHGSKLGYRIFTPESAKMIDARPDFHKVAAIGQEAYSINFNDGNVILSKYGIIRDLAGDRRTGNIAFSIVIDHKNKLSGLDAITLLDTLKVEYYSQYLKGGDNNLDNVREDWSFVNALTNQYENRLKGNFTDFFESYPQEVGEAAFVYYSDNLQMQKYFDAPYQDIYRRHKQIFFVDEGLEEKPENPLNALRHDPKANLTGKIDLDNRKYTLLFEPRTKNGVRVDVLVNGRLRSNKALVGRKDELEITWSKIYFDKKVKKGKLSDIGSEYLLVNDSESTITIKEINLQPSQGNRLDDERSAADYLEISYTEIKSDLKSENVHAQELPKKVSFRISSHSGFICERTMEFRGDECSKKLDISITCRGYETKRFTYCPAKDENPKFVKLEQKQKLDSGHTQTLYRIEIDETKGSKTFEGKRIPRSVDNDPNFKCDANFGYRFEKWKIHRQPLNGDFGGYYEAVFKELWYHKKLAWFAIVVILTASVFGVLHFAGSSEGEQTKEDKLKSLVEQLTNYAEGVELKKETLQLHKTNYSSLTDPAKNKESGKGWFDWFSKDDESSIHADPEIISKIDAALALREALSTGETDKLKGMTYSSLQQQFKSAIESMDPKWKLEVSEALKQRAREEIDLNKAAELIKSVQKDKNNKELADQSQPAPVDKDQDKQNKKAIDKAEAPKGKEPKQSSKSSLEAEFWNLVNSGNTKMDDYQTLRRQHKAEVSGILDYLEKICKNSESFRKYRNIPEKERLKAIKLTQIGID